MKKVKLSIAILIAIVFIFISKANAQEKTMLYEISGKGLDQPSYLFGTIHMQCDEDFIIKDKVKSALQKCEQITFEVDLDDPEIMAEVSTSLTKGKKITEELSINQITKLDSLLIEELGTNVAAVDSYGLSVVLGLLAFNAIKCEKQSSYEFVLMEMAQNQGINIGGLESASFQLMCLEKGSNTEELYEHIFDPAYYASIEDMLVSYAAEDLPALGKAVISEDFMSKNEIEWGLKKRNTNWVEIMPEIMENQPTFFAVGAGHLVSEIGVIKLLKNQGYDVKPIFDQQP